MIKVLHKPHLDLTTPIGRGFIAFLSALAEDKRQRIVKHANDGRAAARKRGVHMGRKPKLTGPQPSRSTRAGCQGRECPVYRHRLGRGSHHRSAGHRIGKSGEKFFGALIQHPRHDYHGAVDGERTKQNG